jgi:Tol biopolymer transport system component
MALSPGTIIGPYEVTGVLGAGGMGEVYRARDTNLNRDVAIKVLPESVADDPDRLARFTREAQTLAALNHPHIAQIYGFERANLALIMELVEGDDLSVVIARGPLAAADALPIARQIADALEAAHEQGIIHRDLKPANVKVRTDGTVKVLDFGLAKALAQDAASSAAGAMNSPTLTARATQLGVILGTAAYMAPEQAKGKAVDRRADIWAFGVVLYEMLTGRRAFEGEDVSTTLAAVLMREPEWSALPSDTPPALRMLVRRCLERDPKIRLRDIGEARILLGLPDTLRMAPPEIAASSTARPRSRAAMATLVVGGLAVVALATFLGFSAGRGRSAAASDSIPVRFSIPTVTVGATANLMFAVSPDGRTIAYVAAHPTSGFNVVWVRPLGDVQGRPLPGTEGAVWPFWSPDNRHIAFAAAGKLKKADTTGGLPQAVCDVNVGFLGGTWNADGTILMSAGASSNTVSLVRVSEHGGNVTDVLNADREKDQTSLLWPTFLPDGRHFLYLAWSALPERRAIYAASLDGGAPKMIVSAPTHPVFVAPGTLLFVRDGALTAQPFDVDRLQLTGDSVRVAAEVMHSPTSGRGAVAASTTGVLTYREGRVLDPISSLVWVNRTGQVTSTVGEPGAFNQVRLSPDETRVAVAVPDPRTSGYNMWVLDLGNKILSQVTFEETANDPLWGPDNQSLAFESVQKGKRDFYRQVIGTRTPTRVYESADDPKWLDDWSRDGKYLLFHLPRPSKLYAVTLDPGAKAMLLAESPALIDSAHFSPDTRWVAYGLDESGQNEVWTAAFPAFDHRRRVSIRGGGQPWWRGDGRELFYLDGDGKMMSVAVTPGANGTINFAEPRELFKSPIPRPSPVIDQYAVTRDGQRFLFIQPKREQETATAPIMVVVNWRPTSLP